jgi:hypothetical protein
VRSVRLNSVANAKIVWRISWYWPNQTLEQLLNKANQELKAILNLEQVSIIGTTQAALSRILIHGAEAMLQYYVWNGWKKDTDSPRSIVVVRNVLRSARDFTHVL